MQFNTNNDGNTMSSIWWTAIALIAIPIVYSILWSYHKDREWRRNNPDEHEILNRKIKDDFSEKDKE